MLLILVFQLSVTYRTRVLRHRLLIILYWKLKLSRRSLWGGGPIFCNFALFLIAVISRGCYECQSRVSLEDCDTKRIKVQCLSSRHCCVSAMAYTTSGVEPEDYARGCAANCSASDLSICTKPNISCLVSFCSSDYCNVELPSTALPVEILPERVPNATSAWV